MSPEQIARLYYQLFNERRLDEAGALIDPQAVFHYLPTRQRLVGRAGYRALAAAWLNAFEDAQLDVQSIRLDGPIVDVEFTGRGTHTGDLVLGEAMSLPATGRSTQLPFHDRLEVRDGLIVSAELDFDVDEMKRRLLGPA
jgi:predicted ester cyclase